MANEVIIVWLVIGSTAGWLAGQIMKGGGFGLVGNTVVGIVGSVVAGWLLPRVGLYIGGGILAETINALCGAFVLLLVVPMAARSSYRVADYSAGSYTPAPPVKPRLPQTAPPRPLPSPAAPMPSSIASSSQTRAPTLFISYRRSDSLDVTGRIYDRLTREYGETAVFRDLDSVPFGTDFREHVEQVISSCDVCLVVIGPSWLSVPNGKGSRRIDEPSDHVRQEIETALKRKIPVVPLLTSGARIPPAEDLPPSLQDLAFRNGIQIRPDPDFHRDMDRLLTGLKARQ